MTNCQTEEYDACVWIFRLKELDFTNFTAAIMNIVHVLSLLDLFGGAESMFKGVVGSRSRDMLLMFKFFLKSFWVVGLCLIQNNQVNNGARS